MLRSILRSSIKVSLSKNSTRTLQTSAIHRNKEDDGDIKENDSKYWETDVPEEDPFGRAFRVMGKQVRELKQKALFWRDPQPVDRDEWGIDSADFPSHVDVVIVGGGAMGSSVAYWLKKLSGESFSVVVCERDQTYKEASTVLSVGGLRQQFSLEENIEMSLFGAEFIRNINDYLEVDGQPPIDLGFRHHGYLTLASEEGAETLEQNSRLQNRKGARNALLTATKLKQKFPWMNTEGIALGCLGLEKEGWFDPWEFLAALRRKNMSMGVDYVTADVKGFIFSKTPNMGISSDAANPDLYRKLNHVAVKTADGEKKVVQFAIVVVAAGPQSGHIAKLARIGHSTGVLSVPLYVEPRKRFVYCFHAPDGPNLNTPMIIDPSGTYFRREGLANHYIVGRSPCGDEEEPPIDNLDVDHDYFQNKIWPSLAHRVPAFENLKVKSSWAGYYDYNPYDENAIIGSHPLYSNMFFATGFSGHGIQQAPAAGRAVSELIINGGFKSLDLTRLGFDRFITQEPIYEQNIV